MIASLHGTAQKGSLSELIVVTNGVGYAVSVPLDVWENTQEGEEISLDIVSYIREDRFDLFGFKDTATKTLFENVIALAGIGPRTGLEICSVPRGLLLTAVHQDDAKLITDIKGIGKKTAEKLLVDLKNLAEKHPEIFGSSQNNEENTQDTGYDTDAIEALRTLGYDNSTIMNALKDLSPDLASTEDRVAAVLRSL